MSSTTETPTPTDEPSQTEVEADQSARNFPGRVRGQRLEITAADLTMYSAITGRAPSANERSRALTWSEADPMKERIAGVVGGPTAESKGSDTALAPVSHSRSLSTRIRDMWFNGVTIRVHRPHFSDWFRRLSVALHQGRQRVKKAG